VGGGLGMDEGARERELGTNHPVSLGLESCGPGV
jgi:hypothetical protein